jgi:hypothetical protein
MAQGIHGPWQYTDMDLSDALLDNVVQCAGIRPRSQGGHAGGRYTQTGGAARQLQRNCQGARDRGAAGELINTVYLSLEERVTKVINYLVNLTSSQVLASPACTRL